MKTLLVLACLCQTLDISAQSSEIDPHRYSRIEISDPDKGTVQSLLSIGIDLHCGGKRVFKDGMVNLELECSSLELSILRQRGVKYTELIPDVSKFYAQRSSASLREAKENLTHRKQTQNQLRVNKSDIASKYAIPVHFELGEMGGFLYYDQILSMLDSMAIHFPDLITIRNPLSDTLVTRQGRAVYWVKISDNAEMDEEEPEVLYTALTHAREPASTMSLLYYMWYLLENYSSDSEVRRIVDHTELYFIPVLNPDGYIYNQLIAPQGGGMWRKNLHDNDANDTIDFHDGVDLNRNYGYLWGVDNFGSSPNPAISTYRGEHAFSEPETQMIREFVKQRTFTAAMHDHTYGNDLYHAWEHGPSPLPDADLFYRLSDLMCWDNRYLFGESYDTYWLGEINGGANDWFYGEQKEKPRIFSWLAEVGPAFWPDPLDIVEICQNQMEPHLMVARIAGQYAKVHDMNTTCNQGLNTLSFRIENLGFQSGSFKLSLVPKVEGIEIVESEDADRITFDAMPATKDIHFLIKVDARIPDGSHLDFDVILEGEQYIVDQKEISIPLHGQLLFECSMDDFQETWVTDSWGVIASEGSQWLTDSPEGDQFNAFNKLSLRHPIDLSEVVWARAMFKAHWSIETTHDFVQLQARVSHGVWTSLEGKYTKPGAVSNDIDIPSSLAGQPTGQAIYDGRQPLWIQEVVDLSRFVGYDSVELRFVAWSGGTVSLIEEDGFYFTDFKILASRKEHCTDGVQNLDESSVDCGGVDCMACATCEDGILNGDEEQADCGGSQCVPCANCADGIQNNNEEGIDCGGIACSPCATCNDGILNGDEEAIDCGGAACEPCATCIDGIQNGSETGIDCGGSCMPCVPTCVDGIKNGDEEDVDCGGSCPHPCKTICCEKENKIWYGAIGLAITMAPNPVKDLLHLRVDPPPGIKQTTAFKWEILDMRGIHIARGECALEGETVIDVSRLAPQVYAIRIFDGQVGINTQRFIKAD